jgi:hypothetical protein
MLHSYGHNDIGDKACKLACSQRLLVRGRGSVCGRTVAAAGIGTRLLSESSDPCRQALAMNDAETGTGDRLDAQRGSAQLLVSVYYVSCGSVDQPGLIRFFCVLAHAPNFADAPSRRTVSRFP